MITSNQALGIVFRHAKPLRIIRQPLQESVGCCLAETVRADRDMPPADRSAMDGYAVRSSDLWSVPCTLRLIGEVAAGSSARPRVIEGTCVRILTGANVPPGADAVVMVEDTVERGKKVTFHGKITAGTNIRRRGEEARKGTIMLERGTALAPLQIGLCAAVGKSTLRVHARPRAAIIVTGSEIRLQGDRVRRHELRDSNGPALSAALKAWGYDSTDPQLAPDDVKTIARMVRQAAQEHEVILLTGGVSVGKYDHVPRAIKEIGAAIHFHGVAMKPGRPLLYATLGKNRHVFGLPGNPLSFLAGFHEFALPALRRLAGTPGKSCQSAIDLPLAAPVRLAKDHRTHLVPARIIRDGPRTSVLPVFSHGSADMAGARQTDGVVIIPPAAGKRSKGSMITFRPWRPLP